MKDVSELKEGDLSTEAEAAVNAVHKQYQKLNDVFGSEKLHEIDEGKGPGACVHPLLAALGWRGEGRHLLEALPHFDEIDTLGELRAFLARVNYDTVRKKLALSDVHDDALPCLFETSKGAVFVILERVGDELHVFDSEQHEFLNIDPRKFSGKLYTVSEIDIEKQQKNVLKHGYLFVLARKFRRLAVVLLAITFVVNLFALAIPIYVMNVYDKVIGTRSPDVLLYFLGGVLIVVVAELALRAVRARALAYVGARCDSLLSAAAFQQILHLPIAMSERAAIGSQITRLKQFEGIRDIFTGTMASAVLDLPFMVVFLTAIIIFGGAVAWVPISLVVIFAIMAALTVPLTKMNVTATGEARSRMQNFLIEMAAKHRAIRDSGASDIWLDRYKDLAADSISRNLKSQQFSHLIQTVAQSLVMSAGVATLGVGTLRVMTGDMTIGALIAVMALVWRVLAPVQAAFLSLNRLSQVIQSFRQVNQLMRLQLEREPGQLPSFYRSFEGAISLTRVGFRYSPRSEPALMGVSLNIPPGQIVAITGPSGAGKSTLLKVISGLYAPQAGAVQIDGLDLRQLDVGELRHAIAYVPQMITFFYGTVDQNVRLSHPTASDRDIAIAGGEAGMQHYEGALPEGRSTRLTNEFQRMMPDGLKQRLMLTRAYVKKAAVYLFDEPANNLDQAGDRALMKKLHKLRGHSTVVMTTHRPSHMKLADRVIYFEHGVIVHDGTPEQILPLIMKSAA